MRKAWCGGLLAVLALAAIGCGGGSSDSEEIEALVRSYYEEPAPEQCASLTTDRFLETVYGTNVYNRDGGESLEACREHQETRADLSDLERTISVEVVRVEDEKAVVQAQGGSVTVTERLIKDEDGEWLLDDEASPFTDSEPALAEQLEDQGDAAPKGFGEPSRFVSLPNLKPEAAVTLVVQKPLDPGSDRSGAERARVRFGNAFGQPGPPRRVRFVNLPITLLNDGDRPFRGEVRGFATTDSGRDLPQLDARDITQRGLFGRTPDWATGEAKGIAPGTSQARFLTFVVPAGEEIVEWSVEPSVLAEGGRVTVMLALDGGNYTAAAESELPDT